MHPRVPAFVIDCLTHTPMLSMTLTTRADPNRLVGAGLVLDSRQRQQTNTAGDSAWAALQAIQSARQLVPDLPHIREPQVKAVSSPLLQGLTRGPMLDALRTGKAQVCVGLGCVVWCGGWCGVVWAGVEVGVCGDAPGEQQGEAGRGGEGRGAEHAAVEGQILIGR
jgi:hypothetical protein